MTLRPEQSHRWRLAATNCRRLDSERGFTLVELLTVLATLTVVVTAVLSISDSAQRNASADQARTDTLDGVSAGIGRVIADMRQACYLIAPDSAQTTGTICRTPATTVAASASTGTRTRTPVGPTAAGPETTACSTSATPATTPNNCLEFLMRGRTAISRDGSGAVTGVTRTLWRVRYNCAIRDPRDPLGTSRQCERFATQCTTSAGATSCPAPCAPSASSCTAAGASTDNLITGSVTNSAATSPTGVPLPIFLYCARPTALSCASTFSSAAATLNVTLAIARRGNLRHGLPGAFSLNDAADLRNNVSSSSGRDDGPGA